MPDTNIKYSKGIVESKAAEIEGSILSLLEDKVETYDQILSAFSVSECEQATQLRAEIEMEKLALSGIADFYKTLVTMIRNASKDVDTVEVGYAEKHVTN